MCAPVLFTTGVSGVIVGIDELTEASICDGVVALRSPDGQGVWIRLLARPCLTCGRLVESGS
jgi:hypothetical protein